MGILQRYLSIDVTMASQPLRRTSEHLHRIEIQSFLRGNHAYMDSGRTPEIGEERTH